VSAYPHAQAALLCVMLGLYACTGGSTGPSPAAAPDTPPEGEVSSDVADPAEEVDPATDAPSGIDEDAPEDAEEDTQPSSADAAADGDDAEAGDASMGSDALDPADGETDVDETPDPGWVVEDYDFVHPDERFGEVPTYDLGEQRVVDVFDGVRWVSRETAEPRPLRYHVILIDPSVDGIGFFVTPPNGEDEPRMTTRQHTLDFVREYELALAVNAHFFSPWPSVDPYAEVLGLAVSDGVEYSPMTARWNVALGFAADNTASIIVLDEEGERVMDPVIEPYNAVGATEQVITAGVNTASWVDLHPRTVVGVRDGGQVVFAIVDGRQSGRSEGMSTMEVGDILLDFGVLDAINLDGGGSTTFVAADPEPRVVNVPIGVLFPGTLRENGSNLGVRANPLPSSFRDRAAADEGAR